MALDGNYSTLDRYKSLTQVSEGISSRILVNIPSSSYDTGITAGHVIHYDTVGNRYVKSIANSPSNAEVFGIVESRNSLDGSLTVVTAGSINLPNSFIILNFSAGNEGGDDVFFLSSTTAGAIENIGPTEATNIIKPIYYKAPHGSFTGLVRNYLGYKTNVGSLPDPTPLFVSFSDDVTKILEYSDISKQFYVKTATYSNNTFSKTTTYYFNKADLENQANTEINFDLASGNCEAKISNDGKELLLLNKFLKKIYYIHIFSPGVASLKHVIDLNLVGNSQDIIWAVDDEITCFTVGTKSLDRAPLSFDGPVVAYQLSSKIHYWKRTVNNLTNPYKWKKIFTQPAFGDVSSKPFSATHEGPGYDELYSHGGVHRLSSLYCKGKNFVLSCRTLIDDQIIYQSKTAALFSSRYSESLLGLPGISNDVTLITNISTPNISIEGFTSSPFVNNTVYYSNHTSQTDNPINKKYCCSFGLDQYQILKKNNNYYYQDNSHKGKNFKYDIPIRGNSDIVDITNLSYFNNTPGKTLSNSIKELIQLSYLQEVIADLNYLEIGNPTQFTVPAYQRNALYSFGTSTETFTLFALLYEYKKNSNGVKSKQLIIVKYPFYAFDDLNVFKFYSKSDVYKRVLPSDGTNFGYVTSFRTTLIGSQAVGDYVKDIPREKIPCVFSTENVITDIDIDQINSFSFVASNDRFFLSTSNKTIIWTFSTSSYIIKDTTNFDQGKFWYNLNGEFFQIGQLIFKYDSINQQFNLQTI